MCVLSRPIHLRERLIHIIAKLEREIESTALDAYEHTGGSLSIDSQSVDSEPFPEMKITEWISTFPASTPYSWSIALYRGPKL